MLLLELYHVALCSFMHDILFAMGLPVCKCRHILWLLALQLLPRGFIYSDSYFWEGFCKFTDMYAGTLQWHGLCWSLLPKTSTCDKPDIVCMTHM